MIKILVYYYIKMKDFRQRSFFNSQGQLYQRIVKRYNDITITTWNYDSLGQLATKVITDEYGIVKEKSTYIHDANGEHYEKKCINCTLPIDGSMGYYSQTIRLYVTSKNGCPVIPPTLSNLEQLATLSESTFIRTMQKYKYVKDSELSDHRSICYTNGGLTPVMQKCWNLYYFFINDSRFECFIPTDMVYPSSAITNLSRSLKSYYKQTTSDDYDVYIKDNLIIAIGESKGQYRIVVRQRLK